MAISSTALFHFTDKLSNLREILDKAYFISRFSLEDFRFLNAYNDPDYDAFAFPMVCFCDLPLSKIKEHIKFYGGYGIGLKKTWGFRKGITPITYLTKKSYLTKQLKTNVENLMKGEDQKDFPSELIKYTKPVEGLSFKHDKNKNFYDEREWRYIPELLDDRESILYKNEYQDYFKRGGANSDMSWRDRLKFDAGDIKYIIVKHENEIVHMARTIKRIESSKYDSDQIDLLISRIITSKQIVSDF